MDRQASACFAVSCRTRSGCENAAVENAGLENAGGHNVWKAVRKVMYRRLGSPYAFIGQSPFYRRQVTAGDNDTALVFADDEQLDLLRTASRTCTSTPLFMFSDVVLPVVYGLCPAYVEHTFPVCFALMTRKTAALYQAVLQKVHKLVPRRSSNRHKSLPTSRRPHCCRLFRCCQLVTLCPHLTRSVRCWMTSRRLRHGCSNCFIIIISSNSIINVA